MVHGFLYGLRVQLAVRMMESRCPACGSGCGHDDVELWGNKLLACNSCGSWHARGTNAADYDAVYTTPEYQDAQQRALARVSDWSTLVHHATYAPFFENSLTESSGDNLLLDVGCGVGRFLRAAQTQGWKVRGIDVSEEAIISGKIGADFAMSTESLSEIAASGVRFNAVTAFEVLEHLTQPINLISDMMHVLKPGGRVFCTVPNRESASVVSTNRPDWLPPIHLQFFTAMGVRRLFERAGVQEVETGFISPGSPPDPIGIWVTGRAPGRL
jgi:SAM-dependent methyltransferase